MSTCGQEIGKQTSVWAMELAEACELASAPVGCCLGARGSQVRWTLTRDRVFVESGSPEEKFLHSTGEREKKKSLDIGVGVATSATGERESFE